MRFNEVAARGLVLSYCSHYTPSTLSDIAKHLKKNLPGFYPKTPHNKLQKQVKGVVQPLIEGGFLVKYSPESNVWKRAREMATKGAQASGGKVPRNTHELYQTNFMYSEETLAFPIIALPKPKMELNFEMGALMHRFKKPKNYTWEMINLLMVSAVKKQRDDLRIHLYMLPFDYNEIEFLEQVLDFGDEFREIAFPLKPNVDEAKGFLANLAVGNE